MIDTDKYEGHTPAPWKHTHIKPNAVVYENFEISFIHTIRGEEIKIADVHLTPDQADGWGFENWKANAQLIADAPLLLAEVKRLRMIVARLEDARIESASMYDRPKLFHAVREIYEQRLQDIYQEKREEE
jgi:hypothetical protein